MNEYRLSECGMHLYWLLNYTQTTNNVSDDIEGGSGGMNTMNSTCVYVCEIFIAYPKPSITNGN